MMLRQVEFKAALRKFWKNVCSRTSICFLILLFVLAGPASFGNFFSQHGYLPSPFFYDKRDTFMDFFNPLYWAMREGEYSIWMSVYPPLNFLLLRALAWLSFGSVQFPNPFLLRDNAPELTVIIVLIFAAAPAFVITRDYWREFTKLQKILLYLIYITSTPFLFSLERGNLIILCMLALPFVLAGSPSKKAIAIAILVNLKPYFIVFYFYYILKKKWRGLSASLIACGLIFFLSGLFFGQEHYLFFENLLNFSKSENTFSQHALLAMPSSVSAFAHVLASPAFESSTFVALIPYPKLAITLITVIKGTALTFAFVVLILGRDKLCNRWIFAVLIVMITNSGISVGGYTFIFYLVLVPVFFEMKLRYYYMIILIFIALPLDLFALMHHTFESQAVYLTKQTMSTEWSLGLGTLIRPIFNLLLLIALSFECVLVSKNIYSTNSL
jgi:hypothetical protein